jgi:hypothetical protein
VCLAGCFFVCFGKKTTHVPLGDEFCITDFFFQLSTHVQWTTEAVKMFAGF